MACLPVQRLHVDSFSCWNCTDLGTCCSRGLCLVALCFSLVGVLLCVFFCPLAGQFVLGFFDGGGLFTLARYK